MLDPERDPVMPYVSRFLVICTQGLCCDVMGRVVNGNGDGSWSAMNAGTLELINEGWS